MARQRDYDNRPKSACSCAVCGEQMPREFWSRPGKPPEPVHCDGSRVAWRNDGIPDPHHGRIQHPNCWRCGQPMGCDQCAGRARDTFCRRCVAWTYPLGLAMNGPFLNTPQLMHRRGGLRAPEVRDYPVEFQRAYYEANRSEPNVVEENAKLKALLDGVSKPMPEPEGEERQREFLREQAQKLAS